MLRKAPSPELNNARLTRRLLGVCLGAPWKGAKLQCESHKPTRQLTLQPVAAEASREAMNCLKPLVPESQDSRRSASQRAVIRMNTEQVPKPSNVEADRVETWGRPSSDSSPDGSSAGAGTDLRGRPARGTVWLSAWARCPDAIRTIHALLNRGHREVVDCDLSGCLDSIPHSPQEALHSVKVKLSRWPRVFGGRCVIGMAPG